MTTKPAAYAGGARGAPIVSPWEDGGVERGATLPADWYTSPELLRLENDLVFRHTWQYAGRTEQVAKPGEYFTTEIADERVLVVRGQDGVLRALSNVCRHRAGPVALDCGQRRSFQCPYHGWIYSLDGQLKNARYMDKTEGFDTEEFRLPEFRLETWGPLIFVSLDPDIEPFEHYFGGVMNRAAPYRIGELSYAGGRRWEIPCNWKAYVDNYMEGYHIPFVHPGLNQALSNAVYEYEVFDYYNEQYGEEPHPRGPGSRVASVLGSVQAFRDLLPPITGLDARGTNGYYFIYCYPNFTVNLMPDGFLLFSIRPLGVDRTESRLEWWLPPAADLQQRLLQGAVVTFGHLVNSEDSEICRYVQKGLESQHYHQGRYSPSSERCLHHFHRLHSERIQPALAAR